MSGEIIKYFVIFVGIISIIGLIVTVVTLVDTAEIDDPQNVTAEEVGWKTVDILWILIGFLFGSLIIGAIVAFIRSLGG